MNLVLDLTSLVNRHLVSELASSDLPRYRSSFGFTGALDRHLATQLTSDWPRQRSGRPIYRSGWTRMVDETSGLGTYVIVRFAALLSVDLAFD
ncbi:hypothetical protein BaRGS_00020567 [Batillaria attramentaria]|uniref:Uncharacterized protein n=1 Tax=Batillaria attramentaria TaxID=370345 RepID=A0ABD0KMM6_9CAEN